LLAFVVIHGGVGGRGKVDALNDYVGPKVVDLTFFPNFVDVMRRILVQDNTRMSPVDMPQRHVPSCLPQVCSSTHKVLLAMMFFGSSNGGGSVSSNVRLGSIEVWRQLLALTSAENLRNGSDIFYLLG
jgi:hypothetical protein